MIYGEDNPALLRFYRGVAKKRLACRVVYKKYRSGFGEAALAGGAKRERRGGGGKERRRIGGKDGEMNETEGRVSEGGGVGGGEVT